MFLTRIELENFRNYSKLEINLNKNLVLLLGDNASGKTNFIESIYFLSRLCSFRAPNQFLVKAGRTHFSIYGEAQNIKMEAVLQIEPVAKTGLKINGQKIAKTSWNSFLTVTFLPSDLNMFTLGPSARREFLNEALTQKSKIYMTDLISLSHVLKQRSSLFEQIFKNESEESELFFWDQQLADLSVKISNERGRYLEYIQERFDQAHKNLTDFNTEFKIEYKSSAFGKTADEFMEILKLGRQAEIRSGQNLYGSHRDDFTINKDGQLNVYNSSRGELRSQVLVLKLLQTEYLSQKDKKPIILLDDVFSELDEIRRTKLIESLPEHQIFITTTEEHHLPHLNHSAQVLKIKDNIIEM